LYAIEGFGIEEIAAITGAPAAEVLTSISTARDHLRKAPGLAHEFRGRLAPTGAA
jgi:DNA-directed RNA polymerase specialized sigma24 family protein